MLGRGAFCISHVGNVIFREVCQEYRNEYHAARSRHDKTNIASIIVNSVTSKNSRFLRKVDTHHNEEHKHDENLNNTKKKKRVWLLVDFNSCIEKVKQTISEKTYQPKVKELYINATASDDQHNTRISSLLINKSSSMPTDNNDVVVNHNDKPLSGSIKNKRTHDTIDTIEKNTDESIDRKRPAINNYSNQELSFLHFVSSNDRNQTDQQYNPYQLTTGMDNNNSNYNNHSTSIASYIRSASEQYINNNNSNNISFDNIVDNSMSSTALATSPNNNMIDESTRLLCQRLIENRILVLQRFEEQQNLHTLQSQIIQQLEQQERNNNSNNINLFNNNTISSPMLLHHPDHHHPDNLLSNNRDYIEMNTPPMMQRQQQHQNELSQLLSFVEQPTNHRNMFQGNHPMLIQSMDDSLLGMANRILNNNNINNSNNNNELLSWHVPDTLSRERLAAFSASHNKTKSVDDTEQNRNIQKYNNISKK